MEQEIDIAAVDAPRAGAVGAGRARGGRPSQQDDLVCLHDPHSATWLLVLADGMGGDGAGEQASAGVVAAAAAAWARGDWRQLPGAVFLEQVCQQAHLELLRRGRSLAGASPHATVVALLLKGRHAFWAHVGDSRLYRIERGRVAACTEDHSLVQERVRRGELNPDQAAAAPDQHQLLRGLGGPLRPEVEHGYAPRRRGQRFVLCSDGVWAHLSAAELAAFATRTDPSLAVREALALVLQRGGDRGDNAALVIVRAASAPSAALVWSRRAWSRVRAAFAPRARADATSSGR
ncbi:MAG TPA: PP2C family serine/threonine-protein phosphatase [Dyella sp.]|nr:PP2C family serine/threonine-protein phosphatase [Dyella sp.]